MKILVTADWHLGVTSYGVIGDDGVNSRIKDIIKTVREIELFIFEQKVDLVIHCGDVFHTNRPTTAEQIVFLNFLMNMESYGIQTRVIIGNHDYNSQLGKGHALKLFKNMGFDSVKIFDQTTWEMIGNCLFIYYPFAGKEPDVDHIIAQNPAKRSVLVCHSHLQGAVVGAEPFEIKSSSVTKYEDLPVDAIFAGHFHKPQILSKKPLVFYPGSIQPVDFNERKDAKGVVLVDSETLEWKPVGFSTRNLLELHVSIDDDYHIYCGSSDIDSSIVKVIVDADESTAYRFDENKIRQALLDAGAHSIASINLNVSREAVKRDPEISVDSGVMSNFTRYVENKDYGDISGDIKRVGREIIEEVCTV